MKRACFFCLLLMTLTGCSDTMAYSPNEATIMQTETTTETTQNSQITAETRATTLPPETATSTESTPETVPESSPAATKSETTTQTCAASAEPAESIIITEAKEAETTRETVIYTETRLCRKQRCRPQFRRKQRLSLQHPPKPPPKPQPHQCKLWI